MKWWECVSNLHYNSNSLQYGPYPYYTEKHDFFVDAPFLAFLALHNFRLYIKLLGKERTVPTVIHPVSSVFSIWLVHIVVILKP